MLYYLDYKIIRTANCGFVLNINKLLTN
jgi:hypothetical protein